MAESVRDLILALEDRRVAAMVGGDLAALDAILADDLSYTHSSGRIDTKTSFLELIRSGSHPYLGVDFLTRDAVAHADMAMVRGIAQIRLADGPGGSAASYPVRFLDVYARRNGAWQLVAWHATRADAGAVK